METFVVATTLFGSFVGAFALQKVALEGFLRLIEDRRTRE